MYLACGTCSETQETRWSAISLLSSTISTISTHQHTSTHINTHQHTRTHRQACVVRLRSFAHLRGNSIDANKHVWSSFSLSQYTAHLVFAEWSLLGGGQGSPMVLRPVEGRGGVQQVCVDCLTPGAAQLRTVQCSAGGQGVLYCCIVWPAGYCIVALALHCSVLWYRALCARLRKRTRYVPPGFLALILPPSHCPETIRSRRPVGRGTAPPSARQPQRSANDFALFCFIRRRCRRRRAASGFSLC